MLDGPQVAIIYGGRIAVYLNPIPHGMCRAHNFMGGGHIDPTTLEALREPKYVP